MSDQPSPLMPGVSDQVSVGDAVERLTLWKFASFSKDWFGDALREAGDMNSMDARRREIVFAVCIAENYLFEWVRDDVLLREFRLVDHYFPAEGRKIGVTDRWRQVVEHLYEDGTISGKPDWGQKFWSDFTDLAEWRNGLIHGRVSRPDTDGLASKERPLPSIEQLQGLEAGWAIKVVTRLMCELHKSVGTPTPNWLTLPSKLA